MQTLDCSSTQIAQELEDSQRPSLIVTWVVETEAGGLQKACSKVAMNKQEFGERGLHATGYSPPWPKACYQ